MLSLLFRPSNTKIESVLTEAKTAAPTWQFDSDFKARDGYDLDQKRSWIGTGKTAWLAAVDAMDSWLVMPRSMVELFGAGPIEVGRVVCVMFYGLGAYTVNPCRITEVIQTTDDTVTRYGFVYATLPGHVESGLERFLIEWDHANDQIWYEITAISRPQHPLAWLAYPYARIQQGKFRERSTAQMLQAVVHQVNSTTTAQTEQLLPTAPTSS